MEAVGAGALENTSMVLKSVWVDSVEVGPRSVVVGGEEAERRVGVVVRVRACLRMLVDWGGCGERCLRKRVCDEKYFDGCGIGWRGGRVLRIASVVLRARRRGKLGAGMVVNWRSRVDFFFTCESIGLKNGLNNRGLLLGILRVQRRRRKRFQASHIF